MGGTRLRIAAVGAAFAALIAAPPALGGAAKRATVEPAPSPTFNWSLSPAKLPEDRRAPARLRLEYRADTPEGVRPPALSEAVLDFDRDLAIDLEGYPRCHPPIELEGRTVSEICSSAIVGRGTAKVLVTLPESPQSYETSDAVVFNKGRKDGVTELFALMYLSEPVPGAIVATIELKKLAGGRFGTEMSMTIPRIVSGSGSITSLVLHIGKGVGYKATPRSIVSARCPDGRLETGWRLLLADGGETVGSAERRCAGFAP